MTTLRKLNQIKDQLEHWFENTNVDLPDEDFDQIIQMVDKLEFIIEEATND